MSILFSNTISTPAQLEAVKQRLTDGQQLQRWIPEITAVQVLSDSTELRLTRTTAAMNPSERLTIASTDQQVIYRSTGGRVAYKLTFNLSRVNQLTVIEEQFEVEAGTVAGLPLKLLAPIAKRALMKNLTRLAALAERDVVG